MPSEPITPSEYMRCKLKKLREKVFPGHGGKKNCAEALGVNAQLWRDWESGRSTPSAKNQKRIASFFGITIEELRGEVENQKTSNAEMMNIKNELERLNTENQSLKAKINQLRIENTELHGALKHLKDLINNPKTVSDVSTPSRITQTKALKR